MERRCSRQSLFVLFESNSRAFVSFVVSIKLSYSSMRATIDGKPVAYLRSPGIAHATKSKVEFGCMGQDGFLADLKIWNAEVVSQID